MVAVFFWNDVLNVLTVKLPSLFFKLFKCAILHTIVLLIVHQKFYYSKWQLLVAMIIQVFYSLNGLAAVASLTEQILFLRMVIFFFFFNFIIRNLRFGFGSFFRGNELLFFLYQLSTMRMAICICFLIEDIFII